MKKLLGILLSFVLIFTLLVGTAAADIVVEHSNMTYAAGTDDGQIEVMLNIESETGDLDFEARTEDNMEVVITEKYRSRAQGTTWIVIYDSAENENNRQTVDVQTKFLKLLSAELGTNDDGAVVLTGASTVDIVNRSQLASRLNSPGIGGNSKKLASTVEMVRSYIRDNMSSMHEHVSVLVLTSCRLVEDSDIDKISTLMNDSRLGFVTTHFVCTAGSVNTFGQAQRNRAERLSKLTAGGGVGVVTDKLTESNIQLAFKEVMSAEKRMVTLWLDPLANRYFGHRLDITEYTSGHTVNNTFRIEIDSAFYESVIEKIQEGTGGSGSTGTVTRDHVRAPVAVYYAADSTLGSSTNVVSNDGLDIWMIILIALIAIIVILVIVLILLKVRKGGAKKDNSAVYAAAASTPAPAMNKVTLTGNNNAVYTKSFSGTTVTVGRSAAKSQLVINDEKVSGAHFSLSLQGANMIITDVGSTNGTRVNGNRITGPVVLNQGDTIGCGSVNYIITWSKG